MSRVDIFPVAFVWVCIHVCFHCGTIIMQTAARLAHKRALPISAVGERDPRLNNNESE